MNGNELKAWRKAAGYSSQADAAGAFGVGTRTYQRWEARGLKPVDRLVELASYAITSRAALDTVAASLQGAQALVKRIRDH